MLVGSKRWSADDMPAMDGRVVIVTGANGGIGRAASRAFARRGATVIMACRDPERGRSALDEIRGVVPGSDVHLASLDLASLDNIRAFAERVKSTYPRLDILCNNAGIMAVPLARTVDGFESQMGVNHLGHFALTGLLLGRLLAAAHSRVVTMSSHLHRGGWLRIDDLDWNARRYGTWRAYCASKLANQLFAYELQRRLKSAGRNTISVACHPGFTSTDLHQRAAKAARSSVWGTMIRWADSIAAQDPERGVLPLLYAATAEIEGGTFVGPSHLVQLRGAPKAVGSSRRSKDMKLAAMLWDASVECTGVDFGELSPS